VQTGLTWPPALPFEQALRQAQAANQQAMGMLYKRFLPVVYRYALAHVGDVYTAEDVTSETFFAIVEHIGETRARDELGFAAWALGIARNKVAMHFRRQRARPDAQPLSDQIDFIGHQSHERDPLDVITAQESWGEVVTALGRLTEEQRSVILYRSVLGYSAEDVGQLLGKQPGAVRALQFRALASLARFLEVAGSDAMPPTGDATRALRHRGEE
jgi:RNA polymerase sigma-70 factor (ECF subfamily)